MNYTTAMIQLPLMVRETTTTVRTPQDIANVCADMQNMSQESLHVITINGKNKMINRHLITLGLADASLVHPRECFRPAILDGAVCIVVVHNHPSGDPTPSAEDMRITRQLVESGKILNIRVTDHVIIGRPTTDTKGFVGMRESGLVQFE